MANDDNQLIEVLQLAVWKEFVAHLLTLLGDETQTLLSDKTQLAVAQTILGYGRDGPGLAIHRMLAEALFEATSRFANPSLVRNVKGLLDGHQSPPRQIQKTDNPLLEDLQGLARLHGALTAAICANNQEEMREVIVGALSEYGHRFSEYVALSARYEPALCGKVAQEASVVIQTWARGFSATRRADEAEGRARYFLWAMEQQPNLARLAANNLMKLPPGHPLRDETRIRTALNTQLKLSIDAAAASGIAIDLDTQTEHALNAMAGLIAHELVSESRIESLMNAGQLLLKSPHLQDGSTFCEEVGFYYKRKALQASAAGETTLAAQHAARAVEFLKPLVDGEADPVKKQILSIFVDDLAGESDKVEETIRSMATATTRDDRARAARLFAVQIEARRAFRRQQYDQVITMLSPVRAEMEEKYLSSVLETEVATHGNALAEALGQLAFSHAHENDWGNALVVLDRAKSLRFRYKALLRAGPMGEFLRKLEADIHAQARGIGPPTAQLLGLPTSLTDLLETYRQAREKIGFGELPSPSLAEISARLAPDEAAVVLGTGPGGMLLAVIRPHDDQTPAAHQLLSNHDRAALFKSLTDNNIGWFIALGFGPAFVEPRRSLTHLLDTVDRIIGQRLAAILKEMPVLRVTIIPHDVLHLVPFWALPSLSDYEVMLAPSAAQFLAARKEQRQLKLQALVVGNPTDDLRLAAVEADRVAHHLVRSGCTVEVVEGVAATELTLTGKVADASIFHFSGHGRSDLAIPTRSALEVNPGNVGKTEEGDDLLLKLAAVADWQPVFELAGTDWIKNQNEHWAAIPGRGRLEERLYPSARRIELRFQHSAKGTLLGQYEWLTDPEDLGKDYGERYRLSELWTAGDILTEGSFLNCDFAFLSSCEAGAGGMTLVSDEFAGLPAALQMAGVASIVSPLWPVRVEVAAIFADLFYAELIARRGEVDLLALVHQTQQRLRFMSSDQVDANLARLRESRQDRRASLFLDAVRRQIQESNEACPFSHPYDWAAFQVTGAPTVMVPFTSQAEMEPMITISSPKAMPAPQNAADHHGKPGDSDPPHAATDDNPSDDAAASQMPEASSDVFTLGEAAETLMAHTDDENLKPMMANVIFDRGLAHQRAQETEKAFADFTRAIEWDPSLVKARIRLGQLYAARHDYEQAVVHYEAAIAQEPDNAIAFLSLGFAYSALHNTEAAVANFVRAIALQPDVDAAYLAQKALAETYCEGGLYDLALQASIKALTLRPEDVASYLQRSIAYRQMGQPAEAIADATRALLFLPESAEVYNQRGVTLLDSEEYERAVADFDKALGCNPVLREALFNRGLTYSRLEDYSRSIADFDAAIALAPELPDPYTQRGLAYTYLRDYERALADHNRALSLDSGNVAGLYNRACMYSLKHEAGSIVADLSAALKTDPSLGEQARSDPDLEWARQTLPDVSLLFSPE